MNNLNTFKTGLKYTTASICDSNCIFTIEVLKRTAKTIRVIVDGREEKTLRISTHCEGAEMVKPHGSYSMAPIITA